MTLISEELAGKEKTAFSLIANSCTVEALEEWEEFDEDDVNFVDSRANDSYYLGNRAEIEAIQRFIFAENFRSN